MSHRSKRTHPPVAIALLCIAAAAVAHGDFAAAVAALVTWLGMRRS